MPFIELRNVSLRYDNGYLAVEGINLSIEEGEFVALVGPSGCGKSTLLRVISGLRPPSTGKATVRGQPVGGTPVSIGMAFQNPTLMPWRTVLQNILLPLEVSPKHKHHYRQNPKPYVEAARELMASVGLSGFENAHVWELSGGMQQRASLCRALIHQPEILMLDEPFSALDAFTREELWQAMQVLYLNRRPTVILVTHDLREAVYLSDTIYTMSSRPGRIAHMRKVGFARPRALELTYQDEFAHIVRELREQIGGMRSQITGLKGVGA
ncbi:MAG: ABC transporter ATP-binding protein [Meiothermus sp.]|uniref:ABC transporter ATP-binding protein n=1 Tax=Meiothermus sp. TaxID=1955249 RepID=UPI0025DFC7C1|nr:ABC transporter ATP-binding protein [Meiothermus sp.]MCS7059249.1 ABC transporter ATP-binding protein [Meiothermus sp.]MCS7193844.1 ABC transporter ATP-binding protein [Meiothermus sp.]MCX7739557.1 ABC transporter ATP-binding protein [Meiothermus sp.]MDW8090304.1 ABC transporter ATP-binding protein [Meiothermus sp.]MDW8481265.1 ABC transporter ATP-binding protein [Meiothermus sp.]